MNQECGVKNTTKRSPGLSLILSMFVFPGAGQLYNKQKKKGLILSSISSFILLYFIIKYILFIVNYLNACSNIELIDLSKFKAALFTPLNIVSFSILMIIWIYAAIDAYLSAKQAI